MYTVAVNKDIEKLSIDEIINLSIDLKKNFEMSVVKQLFVKEYNLICEIIKKITGQGMNEEIAKRVTKIESTSFKSGEICYYLSFDKEILGIIKMNKFGVEFAEKKEIEIVNE
jgi:hypothetical protein